VPVTVPWTGVWIAPEPQPPTAWTAGAVAAGTDAAGEVAAGAGAAALSGADSGAGAVEVAWRGEPVAVAPATPPSPEAVLEGAAAPESAAGAALVAPGR
jgi:hypothetical protein